MKFKNTKCIFSNTCVPTSFEVVTNVKKILYLSADLSLQIFFVQSALQSFYMVALEE